MHDKWKEGEIKILKDNYKDKPIKKLMELLPDRCKSGIQSKAHSLKLRKSEK